MRMIKVMPGPSAPRRPGCFFSKPVYTSEQSRLGGLLCWKVDYRGESCALGRRLKTPFVLDDDRRMRGRLRDRQVLLSEQREVLFHSPARLVKAVLNRMAHAG